MAHFFRTHKKLCVASAAVLLCLLLAIYLYALLLPGIWYLDTFLYRQKDGSFAGSCSYADYNLRISPTAQGADIAFQVNDTPRHYQLIFSDTDSALQILEDGKQTFQGTVSRSGLLLSENGELEMDIRISYGNSYAPPEEDTLFPSKTQLYHWATAKNHDTRGNPYMLVVIFFFAVILAVDIAFPKFFFLVRHGLFVDTPEPSDCYLAGQKFGRAVLVLGILVCIVLSFIVQ